MSQSTSETSQQPTKRKRESSPSPERVLKKEKPGNKARKTKRDREGEPSSPVSPERTIKKGKVASALSTLPAELFDKISEYLPAIDVLRAASTAKLFLKFGYAAADRKQEEQRKIGDMTISLEVGSLAQLKALIAKNRRLTSLQTKILGPADEKPTPLQKHLQRSTYAEILSGRMSLEQALEQIRRLEFSPAADETQPLMKAWSYGLAPWQKTALDTGLPWLSLIYYPHDPAAGGFFTAEEMSGEGYSLLHAEIAHSLRAGNLYGLSISLDNVKTSSVAALVAALSTPVEQIFQFVIALENDHCAIAQAMLAANPVLRELLPIVVEVTEGDDEEEEVEEEQLFANVSRAIHRNALATVRLALGLLTAEQRLALILGRRDHSGHCRLSIAIKQGNMQMAYILMAGLNQPTPLTPQSEDWGQALNVLFYAADQGCIEMVHALLAVLDATQRQTAIQSSQGLVPDQGISALSIAVIKGHTELVRLLLAEFSDEQYLPVLLTPLADHSSVAGLNLFYLATYHRQIEVLSVLLERLNATQRQTAILTCQGPGVVHGESALHTAASRGDTDIVRVLLAGLNSEQCQTAILTIHDKGHTPGSNALYISAYKGHTHTVDVMLARLNSEQCQTAILTPQGVGDMQGVNALYGSVITGHIETVRAILARLNTEQRRAAILMQQSIGSRHGQNSLWATRGHTELLGLLLQGQSNAGRLDMILASQGARSYAGQSTLYLLARFSLEARFFNLKAIRVAFAGLSADEQSQAILAQQGAGFGQGQNSLFIAVLEGHTETVKELLAELSVKGRRTVILAPQGLGPHVGQSALSIAETLEHTAIVSMMKECLLAPEVEAEVALTASSSQPNPVRFFAAPSAAPASVPATEPRPSGDAAQHR